MSWASELASIYDKFSGFHEGDSVLLPISHSTAKAQVEITISEEGEYLEADVVSKDDTETIIPVTEDSGARSSGICPHPLSDKLVYIAEDYSEYVSGKRADNKDYHEKYMHQLKEWYESEFTHPAVRAIFLYLEKGEVIKDLIEAGVLKIDVATGMLQENVKILGIDQTDVFVRFIISYQDIKRIGKTWKDETLYDSFISYNSGTMEGMQLCYATGEITPVTYKHPSKIRNSGDKAKLISSNDESGFAYRGRFSNKEESLSVGYEFSQKMHCALKWLISRQGMFFDTMSVVLWESDLHELPDVRRAIDESEYGEDVDEGAALGDRYVECVKKAVYGTDSDIPENSKVMLLGLDAATTGRLSISIYSEMGTSTFLQNLKNWHLQTSVCRFSVVRRRMTQRSFSVHEIVRCALGKEQDSEIACDGRMLNKTICRLLPCIIEGRKIPKDIVMSLYHKASNPLSYEESYNHGKVLQVACGLIRKLNLDTKKGVISLGYDPNETSRSYLYGCLLAIADKTERDTYEEDEKGKRITNAKRYWNKFSQRPCQTWRELENRLIPYLQKSVNSNGKSLNSTTMFELRVQEIMNKMSRTDFMDNSALSPDYLLGYHHYMSRMYESVKNKGGNDNECTAE